MKYLLVLLVSCSMSAGAAPIKWTSADECFAPGAVVCGSFFFDSDTGIYSHIDLAHTEDYGRYNPMTAFSSGDRHHLVLRHFFPGEPHSVDLTLSGFNLLNPVQQTFDWRFDFGPFETTFGSGVLNPSFEPPPTPAPVPATLALIGLAIIVMRWTRHVSGR